MSHTRGLEERFDSTASRGPRDGRGHLGHDGVGQDGQGSNLLVALSLNLMLLAFFVVLASTATFDTARVETAVASIRANFGTGATASSAQQGGARTQAEASLREAVASAFAAVLPGYEVIVPAAADRIDVVVPIAALFESESFDLRPSLPVLDRLVGVLSAPPSGFRFEAILGATADGDDPAITVMRSDTVARDMVRRGLVSDLLSAGSASAAGPSLPAIVFTFLVVDAEDEMPLRRYVPTARAS